MKEMKIADLVQILTEASKKGCTIVQVSGTILLPEDGNSVVISTEKQW